MRATLRTVSILPLLAVMAAACSNDVANPDPPRELSKSESALVKSDNAFGLKLFRSLDESTNDGENVFISPLSISMALGMTLNGASGATRDSMEATLELAGLTRDEINAGYRSLIDLLTGMDPSVQFDIANSIWYRKNSIAVEQSFIDVNKNYFDAEVASLDFASSEAAPTINGWVNDKTRGKIPTIVDGPIEDDLMMFLINAIYFKGSWASKFDAKNTTQAPFTLPNGSTRQVSLMTQRLEAGYFKNELFQAVDLPYGAGHYSMTILLPNPGHDLNAIVSELTTENWATWTSRLRSKSEGTIYLPKFKLEYNKTLKETLTSLGMGIAFSDFADFTGIDKNGGLTISEVRHKTFVQVDEEGTEAAAVTSVEVKATSAPAEPWTMRVDRPYIMAIRDNHSGTILFMGRIVNPGS